MKFAILAGGRGSRLSELTRTVNKPLLEIGGVPLIFHVAARYFLSGVKEIHLLTGYRSSYFRKRVLEYQRNIATEHENKFFRSMCKAISLKFVATPSECGTFQRLESLIGPEPVMVTYGDTLTSVDVARVLQCWNTFGVKKSLTCVTRPPKRFSSVTWDRATGLVSDFSEKEGLEDCHVGCGFIVLSDLHLDEAERWFTSLESDFLPRLAEQSRLGVYEHVGFWHPVDYLCDLALARETYSRVSSREVPWLK